MTTPTLILALTTMNPILAGMVGVALGLQESTTEELLESPSSEGPDRGGLALSLAGASDALDLDGRVHSLGRSLQWIGACLVFLDPECPISAQYVPQLNRIADWCGKHQVDLVGVLSRPSLKRADVLQFREEFAVGFSLIHDVDQELFEQLRPSHVPEAFVVRRDGSLVYRGRIDDLYLEVGRKRPAVTKSDLEEALARLAAGDKDSATSTEPVGCPIEWAGETAINETDVTFTRHVAGILWTHCVACHRPGEVAPFSLMSYEDAKHRARHIASVTSERFMPPWPAEPGHGQFRDERTLSDREIALLEEWARAGAPQGDEAELPPLPKFAEGWALGEPDLVLEMQDEFVVAADGPDSFRCFVLPSDIPEDRAVVGIEFRPGNPRVVHHALLFLDDRGEGRRRDAQDPAPGYHGFGGPGFMSARGLGGWAPGATPQTFLRGMGRQMLEGDDVIMQVHYHPSGKKENDRSRLGLHFAREPVTHYVRGMVFGRTDLDIAPDADSYECSARLEIPVDLDIVAVSPHMHWIGHEMKIDATLPDGTSRPLIWIKSWDFNWQGQYRYVDPISLPRGTRLDLYASFDNSADNPYNPSEPPRRVRYGEETTDEMCFCFLQYTSDLPEADEAIRRAMTRSFLSSNLQR